MSDNEEDIRAIANSMRRKESCSRCLHSQPVEKLPIDKYIESQLDKENVKCYICEELCPPDATELKKIDQICELFNIFNLKYEPIQGVCDYTCYRCVYKINVILEFRRLLEKNINKNRANYFYRMGNKALVWKYLGADESNNSNYSNASNGLSLRIAEVRSECGSSKLTTDNLFDRFNNADTYARNGSVSPLDLQTSDPPPSNPSLSGGEPSVDPPLLRRMHESPFAERDDRSAHKQFMSANDRPYNYKCQFCPKIYKRPHYLVKHERRHQAKMIVRRKSPNKSYECTRCNETFTSKALLKNHEKSHRNRLKCLYCSAEFYLHHDKEYHEARCYGEIRARFEEDNDDAVSVNTHYTRSRSMRSQSQSRCLSIDRRNERLNDWIENIEEGDNANQDDEYMDGDSSSRFDDDNMSFVSYFSRATSVASSRTQTSCRTMSSFCSSASALSMTSTASTTTSIVERQHYTKRPIRRSFPSRTNVNDRANSPTPSEEERLKEIRRLNEFICGDPKNVYNSIRWRRERKLMKKHCKALSKKYGEKPKVFFCNRPNCNYLNSSLNKIMRHDLTVHKILPLYRCSECRTRFTRENYLNVHQMDHGPQVLPCHLCREIFQYMPDLKAHLELHSLRSHKCPSCPLSFIKEETLQKHMQDYGHAESSSGSQMIHYKLADADDESDHGNDNNNQFKVYVRVQAPHPTRPNYQKFRWVLGDLRSHELANDLPNGVMSCSRYLDDTNDQNSDHDADDAACNDDIPANAEEIAEKTADHEMEILPAGNIGDLEQLGVFSVDAIESEDDERRQRSGNKRKSSTYCVNQNFMDPIVPSYSTMFSDQWESVKRMRILRENPHLPCRTGVC